jgi:hypothetical protein
MSNELPFENVDTVALRWHKKGETESGEETGSFVITATKAIRHAGIDDGGSFVWAMPDEIREMGLAPARGMHDRVGRRSKLGVPVQKFKTALVVSVPPEVIEALGYDPNEVRARYKDDRPVNLDLWAGDGMIAVEPAPEKSLAVSDDMFDPEPKREGERDESGRFVADDSEDDVDSE